MARIRANMEEMSNLARGINTDCVDYMDTIKAIYAITDDLKANWQGVDNQAYAKRLDEQRASIESIGRVVNNYAQELQRAAADLTRAQDEIAAAASNV